MLGGHDRGCTLAGNFELGKGSSREGGEGAAAPPDQPLYPESSGPSDHPMGAAAPAPRRILGVPPPKSPTKNPDDPYKSHKLYKLGGSQ